METCGFCYKGVEYFGQLKMTKRPCLVDNVKWTEFSYPPESGG